MWWRSKPVSGAFDVRKMKGKKRLSQLEKFYGLILPDRLFTPAISLDLGLQVVPLNVRYARGDTMPPVHL